jgi:hypothetical protein
VPGTSVSTKNAEQVSIAFLDDQHREAWDDFCLRNSEAWFWHTTHWLDYTLEYRPEYAPSSCSFVVFVGEKIAAICPLVLEESHEAEEEIRQFSYGGDPVPAPAFADGLPEDTRRDVSRAVFRHIDELAKANRVQRISFRVSPPASSFWRCTRPHPNPLLREGCSDVSLLTRVIDLSLPEDQLLRDMRKGHRADIKRAEKLITGSVLNSSNITVDAFERYRLLHRKAAGRTTRPLKTFELMYSWIQKGFAVLSCATLEGKDIGFALISVYKDGAYYSSGCVDPEFNHLPVGHLLQWRAMQWLKAQNIRHYEIGIQFCFSQPHSIVSEKEWNISFFKRGFGGFTVPAWRAEKFYDEAYCRQVLEQRAAQYARIVAEGGCRAEE